MKRKSGNCIPIVSFIRKDRKRGNRKSIYCQSFGAKKNATNVSLFNIKQKTFYIKNINVNQTVKIS